MRLRAASIVFALLLPALLAQLALPAFHQLHDHSVAADVALPHQHEDHSEHSTPASQDKRHDESSCPTCQLFASLRTCAPMSDAPAIVTADVLQLGSPQVPATAFVPHIDLTQASPRGPPIG